MPGGIFKNIYITKIISSTLYCSPATKKYIKKAGSIAIKEDLYFSVTAK